MCSSDLETDEEVFCSLLGVEPRSELTLLVVNAYAAAVFGRLRNLPMTFVGALVLGLADSYAIGYIRGEGGWTPPPIIEVWPVAKIRNHLDTYNKVGTRHYALANGKQVTVEITAAQPYAG